MTEHNFWRGLRRRRVSRRRVLQAGGAGVAGLAIATLGVKGPPPVFSDAATHYGGRFRTAGFLDTLDPHVSFAGPVGPRVYNSLVVTPIVQPQAAMFDLAEGLERPDETTYLFQIRHGVTIAPNNYGLGERDVDATSAFASFERIREDTNAIAHAFVSEWFDQHDVPDIHVYKVNTPSPYGYFMFRLGTPFTTIPPRQLLQRGTLGSQPVGGGPFSVFPTPGPFASRLDFNKNPNYYRRDAANGDAQLPYVDGWTIHEIDDPAIRETAFLTQAIHCFTPSTAQDADDILANHDVYAVPQPVNTFISFTMNVKRPPWDDARVRKAAMHALDRQPYVDRIYKGHARANGLVHAPMGAFALSDEELEELQPFDPALSRALIQDAGHELPLRISVMFPGDSDIEEHSSHLPIFLEQMAAAGFEVEQDPQDFGSWLMNYSTKDYDASLALNQIYDTPEIPLDFQHSDGPSRDGTFSNGLQDAEIDAALDATKTITDIDELVTAVHEVQRQIYEAGPAYLPIVTPVNRTLYWSFVKNAPEGPSAAAAFHNDFWFAPEALPAVGDASCSGDIDSIDAALILQREAGLTPSLPCPTSADANLDGFTNAIDAALILQHNAGLLLNLPP